jgi:metal-responsive CopG/Arc/MetJ family transcriptional regulator
MKIKVGKNLVASFSYKEDKEPLLTELNVIAAREGKRRSEIIVDLIEQYVKAHGSGNDSFKLDNWQDDPEFQAVPTILAEKEKWDSYLEECNDEELTKIAISAKQILSKVHYCRYGVYRRV